MKTWPNNILTAACDTLAFLHVLYMIALLWVKMRHFKVILSQYLVVTWNRTSKSFFSRLIIPVSNSICRWELILSSKQFWKTQSYNSHNDGEQKPPDPRQSLFCYWKMIFHLRPNRMYPLFSISCNNLGHQPRLQVNYWPGINCPLRNSYNFFPTLCTVCTQVHTSRARFVFFGDYIIFSYIHQTVERNQFL